MKSPINALPVIVSLLFSTTLHAAAQPGERLVVHEWGTFTSLQDEHGNTVGGINTDDEPVPVFVHRIAHRLLLSPNEVLNRFSQGVAFCHPDVTMRLETPVLYFHLPKPEIRSLSVTAKFRGGWLTEFYPHAVADAPGITGDETRLGPFRFGHLKPDTIGSLVWNNLQVGGNWPLTNTTDHVWTSPRAVQAALVRSTNGESERFLFYRGVGNLDAPLKISRDAASGQLIFRSQLKLPADKPLVISKLWFVDIRPNGKVAFRILPSISIASGSNRFLTRTDASFETKEFNTANMAELRTSLRQALVEDGLHPDEADALLNTWELSYFKSPGQRIFFLLPQTWTDHHLPLEFSQPVELDRIMVGRIELITPGQQSLLRQIGGYSERQIIAASGSLFTNVYEVITKDRNGWERMTQSDRPMSDFISVPPVFQTYLKLGRFRNALILHEQKLRPTSGLTNFISQFGLQAYEPAETKLRLPE